MTHTTPACATWCTERWICSWPYWLSTSSSTMITFSLGRARLVCRWCASVCAIFENLYFTRWCGDACWVWWDLYQQFYPKFSAEYWKSFENPLWIDKVSISPWCTSFSEHGVNMYAIYFLICLTFMIDLLAFVFLAENLHTHYSCLRNVRTNFGFLCPFLRATAGTAIARLSHRNSVCLSVRPSVCHTGGSGKNGAS